MVSFLSSVYRTDLIGFDHKQFAIVRWPRCKASQLLAWPKENAQGHGASSAGGVFPYSFRSIHSVHMTQSLESLDLTGFSCIFSALRHLGRSAFQKRKMPIKNAHEFPALQPSHKFFSQQLKQPYRKRNLSAIIARGRFSRLREPFPPAHRLTITRPPQRAHSTRSPLRRGLCASELQISEKGVTLWDLSTQHWAPPAA